jgi:serine/threonine protein kinase
LAPSGKSDEYAPDDSGSGRAKALTTREGARVDSDEEIVAAFASPESERRRISGSERPDSNLFEEISAEARKQRSSQDTQAAPAPAPAPSPAQATPSATFRIGCPVCGHNFSMVGTPASTYQTCPQCSTTFNTKNGQVTDDDSGSRVEDRLIGRTIRGCFIDKKIGEGGMGTVYHAKQLSLDRSVALKVMPGDLARNKNFIQRFEREAKSLAKINHPNILHIYDFGEDHALGIYFMIIEFVDGKDLGQILRERTSIDQVQVLDYVRQAAMGLEMAAEKGVIHRDIKPDNLMISAEGICKVSDFGLAKSNALEDVTNAGVRVGTPAFMSPEQCDGTDIDFRCDVYGLGCTTFLALTGNLPFTGDSPFSIMLKHKTEQVRSLRELNPEIDPRLDQLVQRMLAKKPEDRCATLRELVVAMENLQASLTGNEQMFRKNPTSSDTGGIFPSESGLSPMELVPDLPMPERSFGYSGANEIRSGQQAALSPAEAAAQIQSEALAAAERAATSTIQKVPTTGTQRRSATSDKYEAARIATTTARRKSSATSQFHSSMVNARKVNRLEEDVDAIEAQGDDLRASGEIDRAVDQWMKASKMSSHVFRREQLLQKVDGAQRALRRRRILKQLFLGAVLIALIGFNAKFWPPLVDNYLANSQLSDIEAIEDFRERKQAFDTFAATCKPFGWYTRLFGETYEIGAVDRAVAASRDIDTKLQLSREKREEGMLAELKAQVRDPAIPWKKIVEEANRVAIGATSDRKIEALMISNKAQVEMEKDKALLAEIEGAMSAHDFRRALSLSADYRVKQIRASGESVDLPLPGVVSVEKQVNGQTIEGLLITVDNVPIPVSDPVFCRYATRDVKVQVAAPGKLTEERICPADPSRHEEVVGIRLKDAEKWRRKVDVSWAPWTSLRVDGDRILLYSKRGLETRSAADGMLISQFLPQDIPVPPAVAGPLTWSFIDQIDNAQVIAGRNDGVVALLQLDPGKPIAFKKELDRGTLEVLAYAQWQLFFQAGKVVTLIVEREGKALRLIGRGEVPPWGYDQLRGTLPPQIFASDERVYVIDDDQVHILDEKFAAGGSHHLGGKRLGRVESVAGVLAVPTSNGVELMRLGSQPSNLIIIEAPELSSIGACRIATDESGLLVGRTGGELYLYAFRNNKIVRSWPNPVTLGSALGGNPGLYDEFAVVSDARGMIGVYRRKDGSLLRHYEHGQVPVLAPLITGSQIVVLDADGWLTSYNLPSDD